MCSAIRAGATRLSDDINAKVDIASMAHALEVRCPFLDADVVDVHVAHPVGVKRRENKC